MGGSVFDGLDISESFVRSSGPGGQNVNKVATAVQLRVDLRASALPPDVRKRLIALAGARVTSSGVLVIVSRVHRSQAQNREAARERLIELLKRAAIAPRKRTATRPSRAARERRIQAKKSRSAIKALRTKKSSD